MVCKWSMSIEVSRARRLDLSAVAEVADSLRGVVSREVASALELLPSEEVDVVPKGSS